ncbi:MAG: FkbM family methyltransferase [Desulfatirhabdiaceae bacterium]
MVTSFYRFLFYTLALAGKPIDGIRPRRIYEIVGKRAFVEPSYRWFVNRWGTRLYISPHYHIDRYIIAFGTYDPELHLAMEKLVKPGMYCIDAGANLGEMSLHMGVLVGGAGRVFSFEPVIHVFERLNRHIIENGMAGRICAFQKALSNADGEVEIAFPIGQTSNQGLGSIVNTDQGHGFQRQRVAAITLDTFVRQNDLPHLDFLKLDIQGAEYLLLTGACETLEKFSPLICMEVSPADLRCMGLTSRDLCGLLDSYGYDIFVLTKKGKGKKIPVEQVRADFEATNVLCVKKQ